MSVSIGREDSRSQASATDGGYKYMRARIEELEREVLDLKLQNEQFSQEKAVQNQLECFQVIVARIEKDHQELKAKLEAHGADNILTPIWNTFEKKFNAIDNYLIEMRNILAEIRDSQTQIINKVNDQLAIVENQMSKLRLKQSEYRKKEYLAADLENKLRGVDWGKLLCEQEQKDNEFSTKADTLLKLIDQKEWNLKKLMGSNFSMAAQTSQNMSRQATPPRVLNVKLNQGVPLAFRHSDHLAEDMVSSKRDKSSGGRLPPEISLQASAVKLGRLSDKLADELGEEFNLELSRNSDHLASGDATKKLGFDSQLKLTESMIAKPTLPPRVRISKIRGVDDRSNASMDQKTQSLNNSALNESSRSRKRRLQTNVIIKGLTSSQIPDENETSKRVKYNLPREERSSRVIAMQTFSLHSDDPNKRIPTNTAPAIHNRRSILQVMPTSSPFPRTTGSTPMGGNSWTQDPVFSQLTSKLARKDSNPTQLYSVGLKGSEQSSHGTKSNQMNQPLSDRNMSEGGSSRTGGPTRPKVIKFDIGSERVYSMHSQLSQTSYK
jgi:hypothetical protein